MLIFEKYRKNPRMRFIRSEQANDIFATKTHGTIRLNRQELV